VLTPVKKPTRQSRQLALCSLGLPPAPEVKKSSLLEQYKNYIASKPYVETPEEKERQRACAEADAARRKLYDKGMADELDRIMKGGGYSETRIPSSNVHDRK
jgi:hypothetical protein